MDPILYNDDFGYKYLYSPYKMKIISISDKTYNALSDYLNNGSVSNCNDNTNANFLIENGFLRSKEKINIINITNDYIENSIPELRSITFEVTQKCNLKCSYCIYCDMYDNYENNHCRDLSFESAKKILDFIFKYYESKENKSLYGRIVIGFYGGEPLLNFEFIEKMVDYINRIKISNNFECEFTITTNAILLDRYIDFLANNNFQILISLDGDCNSSRMRYGENCNHIYSKIFNNIKLVQTKYFDYFKNRVEFNSVLHENNNLYSIISYFKDNFNKIPQVSEISDVFIKTGNKINVKLQSEIIKYENLISYNDIKKISPEFRFFLKFFNRLSGLNISNLSDILFDKVSNIYKLSITCTPFSLKLFISANGFLYPCEKIGYKFPIANFSEENINVDFENLMEEYNKYYFNMSDKCSNCYNIDTCNICLFEKNHKCKPIHKNEFKNILETLTKRLIILNSKENENKVTNFS
jgi:uncharacterized protein